MDGDILFWILSSAAVLSFIQVCIFVVFCCSNPVKKMHYYSALESISIWKLVCNINTPWVFPYHNQQKFVFEPRYDLQIKYKKFALNGWTNTDYGSAHYFTQDRSTFDALCRLLKKQNIPYRTFINGLSECFDDWILSHLDINADQDLEVVWGRNRNKYCCFPRLVAAFYTIEVYPEWCDENQYEDMCGILGIEVKKTA